MKKSFFTIATFTKINTRRFFRDKLALFFGIAFPLIFLVIFGLMSSNDGRDVSFDVALINQSDAPIAKELQGQITKSKLFKVDKEATTLAAAKEKMAKNQLDGTIILPMGFGKTSPGETTPTGEAKVLYTQNNVSAGQTLASLLENNFQDLNTRFVQTPTPFVVRAEQQANKSLSAFDYTFAGLLGFSIVGLGIFGPVNVFPELKKQGILRRLRTTQLKVWQYFTSTMLSQALIGLISIAIQFAIAILAFDLRVTGNYLEIALFVVFSIVMILGIGLAIGGWAKNERQAAPLSNIVVFPMLFLSGTFFPRFAMPEWLQRVSDFLPLTPVIDGLRLLSTESKHLLDLGPQLAIMLGWTAIIYFVAFRVFRWE